MGQPVVHFEITEPDPAKLRDFYGNYGFVARYTADDGSGIPGGVGGGAGYAGHGLFYVGVPNVEAALQKAERLGGVRRMGPVKNPGAQLVAAHFTDPAGHLVGLAGPE